MKLNNETVTIELKNGATVHGTVTGMPYPMHLIVLEYNLTDRILLPPLTVSTHELPQSHSG